MINYPSLHIIQDKIKDKNLELKTQNPVSVVAWQVLMLGDNLQIKGGIASVQKLILRNAPSHVQIQHIPTTCTDGENGSITRKILAFGKALGKLLWKLSRKKADLIHVHFCQRGSTLRKMILMLVALAFDVPVVLHAHGSEYKLFYTGLPQWAKRIISSLFRQSAYLIVLSQSWKNFYQSSFGLKAEQVVILPNPVEFPSKIPERTSCNQIMLVFLGQIGQRKGVFDLIRAFASLPPEHKTCSKLILAGDGEVEQACQLVESLDLGDYIKVPGGIDSGQRDALLAKANIFVLPSYNEGLPMALLEAMGWGLPVITTPVGGIPEVVTHAENGLIINPGDIEQLSDTLKSLIENKSLRISLGAKARTSVVPLDVKNYWTSMSEVYRSVLK
ncbi:MAG: glycosyltransferase family 4 protein [Moorea sp. SIO4E2]|uniref:glycosyltransferase family 4 protein n=1 Tax=Moorena sp. SIO4E2 TaxID=2607826 RepID=UPI0013BA2482|nr:glycosyltransferase family 4 protein [Moorena sp. SIO4E2]NEQ04545.1 glycosyltransferase family 4 protein [Moorena sp. SIO4E2]